MSPKILKKIHMKRVESCLGYQKNILEIFGVFFVCFDFATKVEQLDYRFCFSSRFYNVVDAAVVVVVVVVVVVAEVAVVFVVVVVVVGAYVSNVCCYF